MKKIKNFDYKCIGCFKTPALNFTILGDYEDNSVDYHSTRYDMNIMFGSEDTIIGYYNKLVEFLSNVEGTLGFEPDVMFCGAHLNGDNSVLFGSDGTWEFENNLFMEIGISPRNYIREHHCSADRLKENHPNDYDKLKNYLI